MTEKRSRANVAADLKALRRSVAAAIGDDSAELIAEAAAELAVEPRLYCWKSEAFGSPGDPGDLIAGGATPDEARAAVLAKVDKIERRYNRKIDREVLAADLAVAPSPGTVYTFPTDVFSFVAPVFDTKKSNGISDRAVAWASRNVPDLGGRKP